jgi:hypothetical protein
MVLIHCGILLGILSTGTIADEAKSSPTELVRQALEKKKTVQTWVYTATPPQTLGGLRVPRTSNWSRPDQPQKGDLFVLADKGTSASFEVTQILNKNQFLDLQHGFLIEGFDTSTMSDGAMLSTAPDGNRVKMFVGEVQGPSQYSTVGGGKKTVTHIRLSLHPDFVISEKEAADGFRLWRSKNGQVVAAKLVGKRGSQVRLMNRQKKQFSVKLNELSESDVSFLEQK